MNFICEDVGTTARQKVTKSRALRIWEQRNGICVNCNDPIDAVREDWFIEHLIALELGGTNEDKNLGPAHTRCKKDKDAADHKAAAKAKRAKARHLGIENPNRKKIPSPPRRRLFRQAS